MKCTYTTANGRLSFEFESDTEKRLFADLAHLQEIFEEPSCGCCKSDRVRFEVREFNKNKYYKLLCVACGATLDYHQNKEGETLYLKDADRASPTRGWYRYKDGERPANDPKPSPAPATNRSTRPTPPASNGAKPAAPMTALDAHKAVIDLYSRAGSAELVETIRKRALTSQFDFTPVQEDEQSDARFAALDRLGVMAGAGVEADIPF